MKYILETDRLTKKYNQTTVLSNLSIHVEKGAIYGLIGRNGAGKTTLIRLLCGLQKPTQGTYQFAGIFNENKEINKIRKTIGAIVETPAIYPGMTALENLKIQYEIIGMPSFDGIKDLLGFVGLENTGTKKVKNFSLGMKQRLGIAIALASNPDFLILDEPINGLDPEGIIEIRELILKLNKEKRITVLISSHYLDELSKIATHFGFLNNGQLIKEISTNELNKMCKKRIELETKNMQNCIKYLEKNNIDYKLFDKNKICIYGNISISKLSIELSKNNCEIDEIHEMNESLENYYINLIGGANNE